MKIRTNFQPFICMTKKQNILIRILGHDFSKHRNGKPDYNRELYFRPISTFYLLNWFIKIAENNKI